MIVLADGITLEVFIANYEAAHPGLTLEPLEQIPGRPVHYLGLEIPAGEGDAYVDQLEVEFETLWTPFPLRFAEILYTMAAPEGHTGSTYVDGVDPGAFAGQYASDLLGSEMAHARATGAGTVVAVLDTGADAAHPLLAGQVVAGGYDFVDDDDDPDDSANKTDDDEDGLVDEMAGHGTFVAGLVVLVAPDARILPVRVLDDDGNGDLWKLVQGIYHAIDRGVEVINLSLGSTYNSDIVELALEEAEGLGIANFAAAGNLNREEPEEFPAMRHAFGVAALDHNDIKADFSNYSDRLFISGPGTTGGTLDTAIVSALPGGGYGTWEGTSFATPMCSATAALLRSQNVQWEPALTTHAQIETRMAVTAIDIYAMNPSYAPDLLGAGRVDAAAAVALGPVAPELGDLDADGMIGVSDLLRILADWGDVHTNADLDGSGHVDIGDLLIVLGGWG
jgi:subtilisin family serine protease